MNSEGFKMSEMKISLRFEGERLFAEAEISLDGSRPRTGKISRQGVKA